MTILTRRQVAALEAPEQQQFATSSSSSSPASSSSSLAAPTPSTTSRSKRRSSAAPLSSSLSSNLLIELAAPLMEPIDSPFKAKPLRRSLRISGKYNPPLPQPQTPAVVALDKENAAPEGNSALDESDRMWEELNKPTAVVVATPKQPPPQSARRTRRSVAPTPLAAVSRIGEEEEGEEEDVGISFTPAKKSVRGRPSLSLTPGPPTASSQAVATARRRSSIRPLAPKAQVEAIDTNFDAAADFDDEFGQGGLEALEALQPEDEEEQAEEEEAGDEVRLSFPTPALSLTPSSYTRTRRSMANHASSTGRSDRRSLHHTQLLLLKQIVQDEQKNQREQEEDEQEEQEEQEEEPSLQESYSPSFEEQPTETDLFHPDTTAPSLSSPIALFEEEAGEQSFFEQPLLEQTEAAEQEMEEAQEQEEEEEEEDQVEKQEEEEQAMQEPTLVVAPASEPTFPTSTRKTRATMFEREPTHGVAAPTPSRKSLFSLPSPSPNGTASLFSSSFLFHGVTPPSTPLLPMDTPAAPEKEETPVAEEQTSPVLRPKEQRQITPRSRSRRQSLQCREEEEEQQVEQVEAEEQEESVDASHPSVDAASAFIFADDEGDLSFDGSEVEEEEETADSSDLVEESEATNLTHSVSVAVELFAADESMNQSMETSEMMQEDNEEEEETEEESHMDIAPPAVAEPLLMEEEEEATARTPFRSTRASPRSTPKPAAKPLAPAVDLLSDASLVPSSTPSRPSLRPSKKSLLRAVSASATSSEAIPDDILAQLFVRANQSPPGKKEERLRAVRQAVEAAKEREAKLAADIAAALAAASVPLPLVDASSPEPLTRTRARSSVQTPAVPALEQSAIDAAAESTPLPAPIFSSASAAAPVTPARRVAAPSAAVVPVTPARKVLTFQQRVQSRPQELVLYLLAFIAVLAALCFYF